MDERDLSRASPPAVTPVETAPGWMPVAVIVLIVAVLAVAGALVYSVLTGGEAAPLTIEDRDVLLYEDMVSKNPQDVGARAALAQAYFQAGEFRDAIAQADHAIAIQPEDLKAYYVKARAQAAAGSTTAALATYDAILGYLPDDPEAHYGKGVTLKIMGDLEGAIAELEASLESRPVAADIRVELGGLYRAAGQMDKARTEYEQALEYVPDYVPAVQALEQLGSQ